MAEDLMKYGLIPEFVGRLPVVAALHELDKEALVRILTEPRNALTRQYQKLLGLDQVELQFTRGALQLVAERALGMKIGARGLRTVLEDILLDTMYLIPSRPDVTKVVVNADVVRNMVPPLLVTQSKASIQDEAETA